MRCEAAEQMAVYRETEFLNPLSLVAENWRSKIVPFPTENIIWENNFQFPGHCVHAKKVRWLCGWIVGTKIYFDQRGLSLSNFQGHLFFKFHFFLYIWELKFHFSKKDTHSYNYRVMDQTIIASTCHGGTFWATRLSLGFSRRDTHLIFFNAMLHILLMNYPATIVQGSN